MKHTSCTLAVAFVTLLGATMSCGTQKSAASGPSGTRLALSEPADQSMAQGESNKVAITVDRHGFADEVSITFSNLPDGVRVTGDTIKAGDSTRDFVLIASPTARVVDKQIVTVKAQGSNITTSQTFELTVRAKA
jgi:hypothetical protein